MYRGARIRSTAIQNYTTTGVYDDLRWAAVDYDTDGCWSASQPNRLTVPAGVTKIRLRAQLQVSSTDTISAQNEFRFRQGVAGTSSGNAAMTIPASGYTNPPAGMVSDVLDVVEGDWFVVSYFTSGSFSLGASDTIWFALEIVEMVDSTAYRTRDLLDVTTAAPTDGQVLVYNATLGKYVPGTPSVTVPEESTIYKPFRGAMIHRTADTGSLNTNYFPVIWQAATYDTDGFWSASTPSRLTIPVGSGIKRVRVLGCLDTSNISGAILGRIMKNASSAFVGNLGFGTTSTYTNNPISAATAVINVAEGDYFEFQASTTDTAWNVMAARSFLSLEVVEAQAPL